MCRIGGFTNLRRDMMENKNFNKEIKFGNHIQIKRGSGSPQGAKDSFKVGELGYDLTNNDLYIRAESDMVRIGSNIVDTATANSQDLITSHGVSLIKDKVEQDIAGLENEFDALKNSLIDLMFPVGTVITNASSTFDPNKVYRGTTWTRIKGRVIVGVDESDTPFNKTNKTGGHKELQSHTHTGSISSGGVHSHSGKTTGGRHDHNINITDNESAVSTTSSHGLSDRSQASFAGEVAVFRDSTDTSWDRRDNSSQTTPHVHSIKIDNSISHSHTLTINSSGGGNAGNLQPYITKYVWERTA